MVFFGLAPERGMSPENLVERVAAEHGIALGTYPPRWIRAVTHYEVGPREVDALVAAVRAVLSGG